MNNPRVAPSVQKVQAFVNGHSLPVDVPPNADVVAAVAKALTPPPLPAITLRTMAAKPKTDQDSYGIWQVPSKPVLKGTYTYSNLELRGFGNGASIQNCPDETIFDNVRITDSMFPDGRDTGGQGIYTENSGRVTFKNGLIGWSGRPRGKVVVPNTLRHGGYFNVHAAAPTFESSLIIGNASAGLQTRRYDQVPVYRNCAFIDNAISILAIMGRVILEDCLILDAHYQWSGSSWVANTAIMNYWPVSLLRTMIVGVQGQAVVDAGLPAGKLYGNGAISSGGVWSNANYPWQAPDPKQPLITAQDCVLAGWVPTSDGKTFGGSRPHDGSGFKVYKDPIAYDYMPIVNAFLANAITATEAIDALKKDVSDRLAA